MHPTKACFDSFSLPTPTKYWKYSDTKLRSARQIFHAKHSPFRRICYQFDANPQVWPCGSSRRPKQQGPAVTGGCYKSPGFPRHLGSSWSSSSRTRRIPMRKSKEVSMTWTAPLLWRFHCDWHVPSRSSTGPRLLQHKAKWHCSGVLFLWFLDWNWNDQCCFWRFALDRCL